MTKALLAWEIGGGQGHFHLLAAIAQKLQAFGIETIFALENAQFKNCNFPGKVLQAPKAMMRSLDDKGDNKSYLFTDILYIFGFSTALTLNFHLKAWQNLIHLVKPSLIIADYAPALVLAAKGKIPTVVVGNGFSVPPSVKDFPPIRPLPVPIAAIHRQAEVEASVREVTGFDAPLGYLLNGDRSFIFSIPELDPYAAVRKVEYVGIHSAPFPENLGDGHGSAWAYLTQDWHHYSLLVETLKPDCIFDDLKIVLKEKSLAIHHAGSGTSMACLLAGIPQLVFPKHMEQWHTAKALLNLGVAVAPQEPLTKESLLSAIAHLPQITQNAQQQAKHFAYWNQNFLDKVVQTCLELAG
ncbi:MAG: hypothetical protein KME38_16880 [Spirirestis rafaelensis WJT71-NPBG6]|jgi:UDP-N-acetylglucosamine:LPS N-acetylglucosamine transferase|nr:hypothetical protein [Spirirestis rafaelensis WJT71-NPBG6]